MKTLVEYLVRENAKETNISDKFSRSYCGNKKIKSIGDSTTWYYYQSLLEDGKDNFCNNEHPTDNDFIEAFSKAWYPGEGDTFRSYGMRYIAHYMSTNMGLKCVYADNAGNYSNGEQHFQIFYLPLDSKSRLCTTYVTAEENTAYSTDGGFHGNDKDIHWVDDKSIETRKDFAKIVLKLIKSIKI